MNLSMENISSTCPISSLQEERLMSGLSFWLEGVLQSIICLLGCIGNAVSIFLLSRRDLSNSFNQLLATLATFDLIYLATMLLEALRRFGLESRVHLYSFPYFLYPLNSISLTGSIYMTMAIAIERYIAVYHPMDYNRVMTDATTHRRRLLGYLVPVTLVSIIFNIPKFLESEIIWEEVGTCKGSVDTF
ncbi:FMRFamide receptor [Eurytemora carolleeae]|uniref:FMRFamide receptor n=1 Tax=Eurytemora carolleeae TaxID=1294199 RepID=UPI000C76906D|nr:FMRFamide receptor [Eurytemora carolleeae]|eukprot:XP_023336386.1 FMRFamide receptor-like [Eurytemora affinis]